MSSRLYYIALTQVISLILWGLFLLHQSASAQHKREQSAAIAYDFGITSMTIQTGRMGFNQAAEASQVLLEQRNKVQSDMSTKPWLEDHIAVSILAFPAGALSLLVILALFLEARQRYDVTKALQIRSTITEEPDY